MPTPKVCKIPFGSNAGMGDVGTGTNLQYIAGDSVYEKQFDVYDITTDRVKEVLGESSDDVGTLCLSSRINQWALFRPEINPVNPYYNLDDFAGYNHSAYPTTYYYELGGKSGEWVLDSTLGMYKTLIPICLRRGERPPWKNGNVDTSWNYVKVGIYIPTTGQTWYSAVVAVPTDYAAIPVQITSLYNTAASYANCQITTYYTSSSGTIIQAIEATHPNVTINITPNVAGYSVAAANYGTMATSAVHYYVSQYRAAGVGIPIYFKSSAAPFDEFITNSEIAETIVLDGSTAHYAYSECYCSWLGKYYRFSLTGRALSTGAIFKKGESWYKLTSITSGWYYSVGSSTEVSGFTPPTV